MLGGRQDELSRSETPDVSGAVENGCAMRAPLVESLEVDEPEDDAQLARR